MRKLFFALLFGLVVTYGFANENFIKKERLEKQTDLLTTKGNNLTSIYYLGTCTVTISGYDEWGCYYSNSLTFTSSQMTAEICDNLGAIVGILHLIGTLME